jgi:hypothetical protein
MATLSTAALHAHTWHKIKGKINPFSYGYHKEDNSDWESEGIVSDQDQDSLRRASAKPIEEVRSPMSQAARPAHRRERTRIMSPDWYGGDLEQDMAHFLKVTSPQSRAD